MLQQFENKANPDAHRKTTGPEIISAMAGTSIDCFVAAVGTGGTITGVGDVLRAHNPEIRVVAIEPERSAVLTGGPAGPHKIQGIGAGFVPAVLDTEVFDEVVSIKDEDAYRMKQRLAHEEGLLVGISAGANVFVATQLAKQLGPGKNVVTLLCDTGERYFSLDEFFTPDGERR
ncbi:MAG: pyridoxal-phosphate dependent enzyme [Myxococcota bacterium]